MEQRSFLPACLATVVQVTDPRGNRVGVLRGGSHLEMTQDQKRRAMSILGSFQPQFWVTCLEAVLYNAWNYKWAAHYIFSSGHVDQATFVPGLSVSRDRGLLMSLMLRATLGTAGVASAVGEVSAV